MQKVNEFEHGVDTTSAASKVRFSKQANIHYLYDDAEELAKKNDILLDFIKHHQEQQVKRLSVLREYYLGNNVTMLSGKRRKEDHLADHRSTHNFAEYISDFIKGYMTGIPIKTNYGDATEKDIEVTENIRELNVLNDADDHNAEIALNQSIYGRAYEMLHRNQDDETRFYEMDVTETFVIYDTTIERNPVAGVTYVKDEFMNETTVHFYTSNKEYRFNLDQAMTKLTYIKDGSHPFNGVPIIEYENNKYRTGDFEKVLNLIDLYDASQSDTANYMSDINDAMLAIIGDVDLDSDDAKEMKKANIILVQPSVDQEGKTSNADAKYIYKQYDVAGSEAYKNRVFNDILLFTSTPNLLDSNFSGTQSGEALKYKLFGLAQKRATKERSFKKSLRNRYRLVNNVSKTVNEMTFEIDKLDIVFTENLPKDIKAEMDWFISSGGRLSQETMLSQLTFIENAQDELDKMDEEDSQMQAGINMYDFPLGEDVEDEEPNSTQSEFEE